MLYNGKFMPASFRINTYSPAILYKLNPHPVKSPSNRAAIAIDS